MVRVLRRPKPEPTLRLDRSTMAVATETFTPGAVARTVERGQWLRLDSAVFAACRERFAVRLSDLARERARQGESG